MPEQSVTLKTVRSVVADDLDRLAKSEASAVMDGFDETADNVDQGALDVATDRVRSRCIDALLGESLAERICQAAGVDRPDLQILAFDLRHSAPALRVKLPEPASHVRVGFFVAMAGLGTLLGMVIGTWLCVLLRIQPAGYEAGRAIGGLVGPALAVALGYYVVQHDRLRKIVQWLLGITAIGIGVSEVLAWVNPAGSVWRLMRGRMHGADRWAKLKLFLLCIALIVLLQLGKPIKRVSLEQLRDTVHQAIRSWLDSCADLMALLLIQQQQQAAVAAATEPPPISAQSVLEVLQKLSLATTIEERADIAQEVLQECENLGISFAGDNGQGTYDESLRGSYEVIGLIQPGDSYRVLEPPIRDGNRVVVKGRITRKRATG